MYSYVVSCRCVHAYLQLGALSHTNVYICTYRKKKSPVDVYISAGKRDAVDVYMYVRAGKRGTVDVYM